MENDTTTTTDYDEQNGEKFTDLDTTILLEFSRENVPPVINLAKWVTARYGLEEIVTPGRPLVMLTGGNPFAKAPVEMTTEMTVSEFYAFDFHGHKSYRSVDDCLAHLQGYYPKSTLTEGSMLDVIGWDPEKVEVHPLFRRDGRVAVSQKLREIASGDSDV